MGSCKYSHYQRKPTAGLLRKREDVWLKARTAEGVRMFSAKLTESTEVCQEQCACFGRVICCMLNSHIPIKARGACECQASYICLVNEVQSFSGLQLLVMCFGGRCASQIKPLDIQGALVQEGRVQAKQSDRHKIWLRFTLGTSE